MDTDEEIETAFAAAVVNVANYAAIARKHGIATDTAQQLGGLIADMYVSGEEAGWPRDHIEAIIDRYVEFNAERTPSPRSLGNVVPFVR